MIIYDRDVFALARLLIKRLGRNALSRVALQVEKLDVPNDGQRAAAWRRIAEAIEQLGAETNHCSQLERIWSSARK